jgi:hypothetical protein
MRILLRHKCNNLYLQGSDRWTKDPDAAFDFRFIDRALQFIKTSGLQDVELAFAWPDHYVAAVSLEKAALQYAAA